MRRLLILFIPIALTILLNPLTLLTAYTSFPRVERPEDSHILVNGMESDLTVKPGDKVSMTALYSLTREAQLRIATIENASLKIDGEPAGEEVVLSPGEHAVYFEASVPADFLSTRSLLAINPMSSDAAEVKLTVFILPKQFVTLQSLASTATLVEISTVALSIFICSKVYASRGQGAIEEKRKAQKELVEHERKLSKLGAKIKWFYNTTFDFLENYGLAEDFRLYVEKHKPVFATEEAVEPKPKQEPEHKPIRIVREE